MKTGTINGGKDMKKYSWIVALFLALSLSAMFISCGVDPIVSEPPAGDGVTYTEVALGAFNIWAGDKEKQQGWATGADFKFKGVGDKLETAKDAGYKAEDFQAAQFLEFELVEGAPKFGTEIIWGAAEGNASGVTAWASNAISDGTGKPDSAKGFTIEEGEDGKRIAKIELKKALSNYGVFKGTTEEVKIILQHWGGKGIADMVVPGTAKLLIPDTPVEFKEITSIALVKNSFFWSDEAGLKLEAKFTPEDATKQIVTWAIKSYLPKDGKAADLIAITGDPNKPDEPVYNVDADGKPTTPKPDSSYNDSKAKLLEKINFIDTTKEEVTIIDNVWPEQMIVTTTTSPNASKDTIYVPDANSDSVGTVTIVAIVREGKKDGADYTQELTVSITEPPPFTIKVGTAAQEVNAYNWGGQGATLTVLDDKSGFAYTAEIQNYQANFVSFKVDLGTSKKLSDFDKVTLTIEGTRGDVKNKPLQLWARGTSVTGPIWSNQPIVGRQQTQVVATDPNYQYTSGKKDVGIVIGSAGDQTGADWNKSDPAVIAANVTTADGVGNNVWIVIYLGGQTEGNASWTGNATGDRDDVAYTISNITFVPK